jgi:transketolase
VHIPDSPEFQAESPEGRNIHFGVREHGMGAIVNGMALFGGILPFGSTFFIFSDYMRPALRVAAMSHIPSIWIFTHDSIGLGEDGPSHQPIEQLASMRAIPGQVTIRPADSNEVAEAWKVAIRRRDGPTAIVLTRQTVPIFDRTALQPASGLLKGAYVLADFGKTSPALLLMASGSEVAIILEAGSALAEAEIPTRVISFPSWELFEAQDDEYRRSVLPPSVTKRLAVEAGVTMGWHRYVGENGLVIGIDRFGASAPARTLFEKFGFTKENIIQKARLLFP